MCSLSLECWPAMVREHTGPEDNVSLFLNETLKAKCIVFHGETCAKRTRLAGNLMNKYGKCAFDNPYIIAIDGSKWQQRNGKYSDRALYQFYNISHVDY